MVPTRPPTRWTPTTSSESSYPSLYLRPTASAQIAPAATPIAIAPIGVTAPHDGVIATRPLTTPDAAPNDVAWPSRIRSTASQASRPVQPASRVLTKATAARWLAPSAEPALKPNQPNHSRPAPIMTRVRLCGFIGSRPKPMRRPSTSAAASPAAPELISTAVPPAKSSAPELVGHPAADVVARAEVEDPVRDRRVDEDGPDGAEDQPGPEPGAVGDRAGDQADRDHARRVPGRARTGWSGSAPPGRPRPGRRARGTGSGRRTGRASTSSPKAIE